MLVMREKEDSRFRIWAQLVDLVDIHYGGVGVLMVSRKRKLDLDNVEGTEADAS